MLATMGFERCRMCRDNRLASAVRLLVQVFMMRADRLGFRWMTSAIMQGGDDWTLAGHTEADLLVELDSVNAFVFLEDLEQRYTVNLVDVRQLLLDRLADPWPPSVGAQCYG